MPFRLCHLWTHLLFHRGQNPMSFVKTYVHQWHMSKRCSIYFFVLLICDISWRYLICMIHDFIDKKWRWIRNYGLKFSNSHLGICTVCDVCFWQQFVMCVYDSSLWCVFWQQFVKCVWQQFVMCVFYRSLWCVFLTEVCDVCFWLKFVMCVFDSLPAVCHMCDI